jgi:selenocysteine lyase/cysteine desulfurase
MLEPLGFAVLGPRDGANASGITTVFHPKVAAGVLQKNLESEGVVVSLRHDGDGREYLRFSPHFYNTEEEIERVATILARVLAG